MSDRRLSDPDTGAVTETWAPKIRGLVGGGGQWAKWQALYAGDSSLVDDIKAAIEPKRLAKVEASAERPTLSLVLELVMTAMSEVWEKGYDNYVYRPYGLTRKIVVGRSKTLAPLPDQLMDKVVDRGNDFYTDQVEFGCHLLVCGFQERGLSCIAKIDQKGDLVRGYTWGYQGVGEGANTAEARLETLGYRPDLDLARVLYMAIDAKISAERIGSVGTTTDAWVMLPHLVKPKDVPADLVVKIADARREHISHAPMSGLRKSELPAASRDWRKSLAAFAEDCYEEDREAAISSPTAPARRASRSRSGGTRSASRRVPSRPSVPQAARAPRQPGSSPDAPSPHGRSRRQAR